MNAFFNKLFCFRAFSSFEYGSKNSVVKHSYRVTSFYWVYATSDGERIIIHVPKCKATHVGGYGICGVIVPFNEIKLTKIKIAKRWHFRDNTYSKYLIMKDKEKYKMYKSIPKGLSSHQLSDIVVDIYVESAMKKYE